MMHCTNNLKRIAVGSAQFGSDYGVSNKHGVTHRADIEKILLCAREHSISLIDTAISYGNAPQILGSIGIEGFNVVTKLPKVPVCEVHIASWLTDHVRRTKDELQVSHLYGVLLHHPEDALGAHGQEIIETLRALQSNNEIQKFGVSVYNPLQVLQMPEDIGLAQIPFNVFDQRLLDNDLIKQIKSRGIEIHLRSVFLQGLLLMPSGEVPSYFQKWRHLIVGWQNFLDKCQQPAVSVCLNFALSIIDADKIVIGVNSVNHLREIVLNVKEKREVDLTQLKDLHCLDENFINPSKWELK